MSNIVSNSEIHLHHCLCESRGFKIRKSNYRRCSVKKGILENFAKLTEKDLCPSPTLVFYWQFYEIFENTFFTEHLRATASDEKEAWWSKILILSFFLKKIFVEVIGVFNSELCWKIDLCNSPPWPLGGTLHVNFQPRLKFIPGWIQLYLWLKLSSWLHAETSWKLSPTVISINAALIRHVFNIDYVKLHRYHAEFSRSKKN